MADRRATRCDPPHVEDLLRELAPQVLGVLVRRHGQFDACEDAVQEALLAAAAAVAGRRASRTTRAAGCSPSPSRRLTDQWRSEQARRRREVDRGRAGTAGRPGRDPDADPDADDTLTLLFLCCHPALTAAVPGRADAARGRRPDHRRDRPRVPGARGDHGAADQPGQAAHQGGRRRRSRCRRPEQLRGPAAGGPARALPDLQRGLHAPARARSCTAPSSPRRRSG